MKIFRDNKGKGYVHLNDLKSAITEKQSSLTAIGKQSCTALGSLGVGSQMSGLKLKSPYG